MFNALNYIKELKYSSAKVECENIFIKLIFVRKMARQMEKAIDMRFCICHDIMCRIIVSDLQVKIKKNICPSCAVKKNYIIFYRNFF